ncbi:hypothetical protein CB1_000138008 [Camelus ferus]|nr:hypothetical protein CB1_000138008 [Camelus ferus]
MLQCCCASVGAPAIHLCLVTAMILAGKAYYDGVAKIGEIAAGSPVSTELAFGPRSHSLVHHRYISFQSSLRGSMCRTANLSARSRPSTGPSACRGPEFSTPRSSLSSPAELGAGALTVSVLLVELRGRVLIEISSTHKKLNESLDENFKNFHKEIIRELEKKTELDVKYMNIWNKLCTWFTPRPWTVWSEWMPDAASVVCTGDQEEESSRLLGRGAVCLFKNHPDNSSDDASLQRSVSVATGLNMVKKQKVKTIFPHTAGANQTLLSFQQGDVITLLISEEKDGWLYGEHDTTKARGWFPSSYTKALEEPAPEAASAPAPSSAPVRSVSTVNLAEKSSVVIPPPDYLECLSAGAAADKKVDASQNTCAFKAPVSKPETVSSPSDANGIAKPPFLRYVSSSTEPFALQVAHPCG